MQVIKMALLTQAGGEAHLPANFSGSLLAMKRRLCNRLLTACRWLNAN
jgi:hypothetical protein